MKLDREAIVSLSCYFPSWTRCVYVLTIAIESDTIVLDYGENNRYISWVLAKGGRKSGTFGMSRPAAAIVTLVIDRGLMCVSHLISFPSGRNIHLTFLIPIVSRNSELSNVKPIIYRMVLFDMFYLICQKEFFTWVE